MHIPYVIDNHKHSMAGILGEILAEHEGRSLDIATAYFSVNAYGLLRQGLGRLGSFRLLLGSEPQAGEDIGIQPVSDAVKGLITAEINDMPFSEERLRLVEDLSAFLARDSVQVRVYTPAFLHAKAYIFYNDLPKGGEERLLPVAGIVGSSNFTVPGLTTNRELNLSHTVKLGELSGIPKVGEPGWSKVSQSARAIQELDAWFTEHWTDAVDFKQHLLDLINASKFGKKTYTPYQIYLKALYEYFKDDLGKDEPPAQRSAVELAEFQDDAVKKARRILLRYDGVMVADSVGLGKTWIGKKLLEDFAYFLRQNALVICPASLRDMWDRELKSINISAHMVSQEEMGREEFDATQLKDVDVILVDESHNFRSLSAQRYDSISAIIKMNGGKGRSGNRKKVILLTATPIHNDLFDLYHQLVLITQGERGYFSGAGIGDLQRYFFEARKEFKKSSGKAALFNLLEEIVIRRTRKHIIETYPTATVNGELVKFPDRKLRTITYDLEQTYNGIYEMVTDGIDNLKLAPYNIEEYRPKGSVDKFALGRGQALVGIFKSRYLKRFESSVDAFRISIRRALEFLATFESYAFPASGEVHLLSSKDFYKALRYVSDAEGTEDEVKPRSRFEELQASEQAQRMMSALEPVSAGDLDLDRLRKDLHNDILLLRGIWESVKDIGPEQDAKLARLKDLLRTDLRGKKLLVFTYYKDTARYLFRQLGDPKSESAEQFRSELGGVIIRRMDSGADAKERRSIIERFSPKSNKQAEISGSPDEVDILLSTDVLSEGQNLQDCGYLINYDLHWNPTRMIQRAGRIDRIGTEFQELLICNMFPDEGLEKLLKLLAGLSEKLSTINQAGFLDASVLGEEVTPQVFGVLKRIGDEDENVISELEEEIELPSSEVLLKHLKDASNDVTIEELEQLPDGIHSGLSKSNAEGAFFYFRALHPSGKQHFWRYVDLTHGHLHVEGNRYRIHDMIRCKSETDRVVPEELFSKVFDLQEAAIAELLAAAENQQASEVAPVAVDPVQNALASVLEGYLSDPALPRDVVLNCRIFVTQPLMPPQVKALRDLLKQFKKDGNAETLLSAIHQLADKYAIAEPTDRAASAQQSILREKLRLVCFDFLSS